MAREFWKPNTKLGHSTLWRYTILCLAVALIYPHTCHWEHCACCWCWCYAMLCVHGMLSIPLPSPSLSSSSSLLYHSCRLDCGLYRIEYTALSLSFSVGVLLLAAAYDAHTSLEPLLTLVTCECLNAKHAYFLFLSHLNRVWVRFANSKNHGTPTRNSSSNIISNKINW